MIDAAEIASGVAFAGFVLALVVRALVTETAATPWRDRARSRRTVRTLDAVLALCGLALAAGLAVVVVVSLPPS